MPLPLGGGLDDVELLELLLELGGGSDVLDEVELGGLEDVEEDEELELLGGGLDDEDDELLDVGGGDDVLLGGGDELVLLVVLVLDEDEELEEDEDEEAVGLVLVVVELDVLLVLDVEDVGGGGPTVGLDEVVLVVVVGRGNTVVVAEDEVDEAVADGVALVVIEGGPCGRSGPTAIAAVGFRGGGGAMAARTAKLRTPETRAMTLAFRNVWGRAPSGIAGFLGFGRDERSVRGNLPFLRALAGVLA